MPTTSVVSKALISKRNTEQSPFLRLPGELRNKVYANVLAGMDYRVENYNGLCGEVSWKPAKYHSANRDSYKGNKHRLSLVRTCRQVHEETKNIHAGLSTFHFNAAWMMVNWTIPQGTNSVVIHDTVSFNNALQPFDTSVSSIRDIARAYTFWGDAATVTALHLKLVCRLPHNLRKVKVDDLMNAAGPCVQQWVQGVREVVHAVKAGVSVTASLIHHNEEVLTLQ